MKIIISPAKVQTSKARLNKEYDEIKYKEKTQKLEDILRDKSKARIGTLMNIKGPLLDKTYENYQNIHTLKANHAISMYNGIVFKEINSDSYDDNQINYVNEHLRILSAYYGVLTPLTGIKEYRLDMTMKPKETNLYEYWEDEIKKEFGDEDIIINLASKEYYKMLIPLVKKEKNIKVINIIFNEEKLDGTYKIVTVRAKKARGLMVDYLATNLIHDVEKIKEFTEDDYFFNEELSDEQNFVFTLDN